MQLTNFPDGLVFFLLKMFLSLAILASVIYLLWGVFCWIFFRKDAEKVKNAKSTITTAIIILVFIVFVYFGLDYVLQLLGFCEWIAPPGIVPPAVVGGSGLPCSFIF